MASLGLSWNRLRYEMRLLGIGAWLLPLGIVVIYLGFSLIARASALRSGGAETQAHVQMGRGLLALLENGLPLAAGLLAAMAVRSDAAIELHLSLPASYRGTALRRLGLVLLWSLVVAGLTSTLVIVTEYWVFPVSGFERQLLWLPPLLCLTLLGAVLTLLLHSQVASSAILGMLWIGQFLFHPLFMENGVLLRLYLFLSEEIFPDILEMARFAWYDSWLQNRLVVLAVALPLVVGVVVLLGRHEALLGDEC
ncbi:MAG TPA: hypothetical protein VFU63_01175 [Ktedonobacterales bacterium]|nr:hypothetical protein [Ktedonobacterales bacterium]